MKSTATMADGTECIVGYKVRVNTNIDDLHYGITKYRNAVADEDSDLWKNSDDELMLNENDEFIITAKRYRIRRLRVNTETHLLITRVNI